MKAVSFHFLDESGDPGIPMVGTSSSHFILALVQLSTRGPVSEIVAARRRLGLRTAFEFRYYNVRESQKDAFFTSIQGLSFQARAAVLDKDRLPSPFSTVSGPRLIVKLFVQLALRIPETAVHNDILIIDGAPPQLRRNIRVRLSAACREIRRQRLFKKIIAQNSKGSDGLQLADMVAGAIRDHVTGHKSGYYYLVEPSVVDLWLV